jgi:hypothetical protein
MSTEQQAKTIAEQAFEKACNEFEKELIALQEKHGLVIIPKLNVTMAGIVPGVMYMDKKTYDAQQAMSREALANSK